MATSKFFEPTSPSQNVSYLLAKDSSNSRLEITPERRKTTTVTYLEVDVRKIIHSQAKSSCKRYFSE